ncbi:effector protein [Candidatus Phytoplasma oryzae]|uniref:effector protein n=1 Tax=Candidatus Phytoplasma oryzae TaxID=203274 RepID=UPI001FE634C9|nr:effector protein [Candidatus Phytoplasma oryzae]
MNFNKTNLVFAGKFYSKIQKTDSSEKMFDSSQKEMEILKFQIDDLSKQKNSILKEIVKLKKELEKYLLQIENQKKPNKSKIDLNYLNFKIYFSKKKESLLKKQLYEISLEQIDLEIKLRKILYSFKN